MRERLAILCALLVAWASCPCPAGAASEPNQSREKTVQEQAAEIPLGAVVIVKTIDKRKLTGRIGAVTDLGFELQRAKGKTLVTETLKFEEVKSVQAKSDKLSTAAKIGIGVAIGAGAFFALVGVMIAMGG
jgi:hypothetical protein